MRLGNTHTRTHVVEANTFAVASYINMIKKRRRKKNIHFELLLNIYIIHNILYTAEATKQGAREGGARVNIWRDDPVFR